MVSQTPMVEISGLGTSIEALKYLSTFHTFLLMICGMIHKLMFLLLIAKHLHVSISVLDILHIRSMAFCFEEDYKSF